MSSIDLINMNEKRIKIEKPAAQETPKKTAYREELNKYIRLVSQAPEPNMGRVLEIKEEIKDGTYLQPEMIEGTAMNLARRLYRFPH